MIASRLRLNAKVSLSIASNTGWVEGPSRTLGLVCRIAAIGRVGNQPAS